MKKGDIVLNKFGGIPENRILVYLGDDYFIYYYNNEYHKGKWDRKAKYHDGTLNLEVIGHSDFFEVLKTDMVYYQNRERLKESDK